MISVFAVLGFITALAALIFATEGLRRLSQRGLNLEIALDAANRRYVRLEAEMQRINERRGNQSQALLELEKTLRDQGLTTSRSTDASPAEGNATLGQSSADPMEAMLQAHQKTKKSVA